MTTAAVPSTNPVDFLLNVETLDRAMNSSELTFTDRLGNLKSTLAAAIDSIKAFNNRGAWAATTVYFGKDLASSGGSWYVCVVPHTSSAAFATDTASKWRLYQGVTLGDLSEPSIAGLMGFDPTLNYAVGTIGAEAAFHSRNVRLFPWLAKGDGSASDVAAIQAAQDSLPAEGGEIYLPPGVYRFDGTYPAALARVQDGVKLRSNITYRGVEGATEVRLSSSCICGFTTRMITALTDPSQAPTNIAFYGITFTRPASSWANATENTGLLEIGAVNGLKIQKCQFIGWPGDAILLGCNNNASLSAVLDTYVKNVDISNNYFDGINKDNRQAISLLCGENVNIYHNSFIRTTRSTSPAMPGCVDIEPIIATALVSNIKIEDNTFEDIGGVTGVVSGSLGVALNSAANGIHINRNVFKKITNVSDIYVIGKPAANHTAIASGSPYTINVNGNTHEDVPVGASNRRWYVGGVKNLTIAGNTVTGGNVSALIGYDDGVNHYPIQGLFIQDNQVSNWVVEGASDLGILYLLGGMQGGEISRNTFTDCGNMSAGIPINSEIVLFGTGGFQSKNFNIVENAVLNSGVFSVNSVPFYMSVTPANPESLYIGRNTFSGLSGQAYSGTYSAYLKMQSDYCQSVISIPSTGTPNLGGGSVFVATTGDTFTSFTGGKDGQIVTLLGVASGAVIQHSTLIVLTAGANFTLAAGKTISLICNSGKWYQV